MRRKKIYSVLIMTAVFVSLLSVPAYASGDVAGAVESTWSPVSSSLSPLPITSGASSGCENLQPREAVMINIYMGFCLVEDTG